ncbi:hypothetical protein [Pararhodobacter sp. SW119]|uniref:hypothetical protein n=1 Tax=Pararhodobacter sp. SW119 TaxID=2780075 RepID=UPI001AE0B8DD|nr:hypothetical protein [Pararhodobacter sp. SW119]
MPELRASVEANNTGMPSPSPEAIVWDMAAPMPFSPGSVIWALIDGGRYTLNAARDEGRVTPPMFRDILPNVVVPAMRRGQRMEIHGTNADRPERVTSAVFDLNAAEILADLLPLPAGRETLSDMDLIPAAIAIQHNLELVVCDHHAWWHDLSQALAPEIGRLELKIFPLLPD